MSVASQSRDNGVAFYRPPLDSGENEKLCDIVCRGRKALGALFLSQLQNIAAIEASEVTAEEPLQKRQLSFVGFRRAVMAYRPGASKYCQAEFSKAVAAGVIWAHRTDIIARSCDDFTHEQFQRSYLGARAPQTLSRTTFKLLVRWAHEAERTLETLLLHNTGLVINLVWRGKHLHDMSQDYLMEGMLGLRRAILRYDKRFGCKLSTFATHWIKQGVYRYSDNRLRIIRLPVHVLDKLKQVRDAESAILEKARRNGGRGERASVADIAKLTKLKPDLIVTLLNANDHHISTDHPVREEIGNTFGDLLTDGRPSSEDRLILTDQLARLEVGMNAVLNGRERHVIHERFYGDGRTLEEIAGDFELTRERIRQIEKEALGKLLRYFGKLDTL